MDTQELNLDLTESFHPKAEHVNTTRVKQGHPSDSTFANSPAGGFFF